MRYVPNIVLSIFLTLTTFTTAMAAPTDAEVRAALVAIQAGTDTLAPLVAAQAAAQTRYDAAVAAIATPRITNAQDEILAQQVILDDAAGTATAAMLASIPVASAALTAANGIVDPALARVETTRANLAGANTALNTATASYEAAMALLTGAITAVPTPTDLSAMEAQIALLQQQVNALAAADAALTARTSNLEAQATASTTLWAQLCGNLKVSYDANCDLVAHAAAP